MARRCGGCWPELLAAGTIAIGIAALPGPAWSGANLNPGVFPPQSKPFGATYGEWSAAHWNWSLGESAGNSPVVDSSTPAKCAVGQIGPVWFLGGPISNEAETRKCNVPAGKAILVPIINAEWSAAEGNCPLPGTPTGSTEPALRACAAAFMDLVETTEAKVDFVGINNAAFYRFQSPLFRLTAVAGNWAAIPPGTYDAVADGFYFMLQPLRRGSHTIYYKGTIPSLGFGTEATYTINVGPSTD